MKATRTNRYLAVLLVLGLAACSVEENPQTNARKELGYEVMVSAPGPETGPVPNEYFMPTTEAVEAQHTFSGVISIPGLPMKSRPTRIEPGVINGKQTRLFPTVEIAMFSDGRYLVPADRELIEPPDGESFWQIQFEPGRVWSEPGDRGYSRASFPFMLTGDVEGDAYNGIATFLYDEESVSRLRYQVVQQSTPYFIQTWFVAWDQVPITYRPGAIRERERLAEAFRREIADRLPRREWSELEARYGQDVLADFDSSIDPAKVTVSGLVIDGTVYASPSKTPYGEFPYPEEMRHGVWSVTKSMLGMVAMLRLAQKYGDSVFDLKIRDYLDVTADHDGWDEVTFGHALSMATGIGAGSEKVDPNDISDGYISGDQEAYDAWYLAPSLAEKLEHVFRNPNHPWGPGVHARYRDRDIFVLSAAMDSLLKSREGADAELWEMMNEEVYGPIGIQHMSSKFTSEPAGGMGVPFLGWALFMTVDDIAKISMLLQNQGRHEGVQILSPAKLAEALYQADVRGLPTGESNEFGANSYHMSLWHTPFITESGDATSIAEMHGWGGMLVCLMPNGMTGFRIGNGGTRSLEMIQAADRVRPFDSGQ